MRAFLIIWTLSWFLLGSCVSQADEEAPTVLSNNLVEYCVACLTYSADPQHVSAILWLETAEKFDSEQADRLFTNIAIMQR